MPKRISHCDFTVLQLHSNCSGLHLVQKTLQFGVSQPPLKGGLGPTEFWTGNCTAIAFRGEVLMG